MGREHLKYLGEFRLHWQSLLGASVGLALGAALLNSTKGIFGPALIADLGWSRAEFALADSLPLLNMLLMPLAGRFTDRFGVRTAAMVGFTSVPLGFLALSLMGGSITEFLVIIAVQNILGILTTSLVFTRVVVDRFDTARGIALSLVTCAAPLSGAVAAPLLGEMIAEHGWRTGYLALAVVSGIGGLLAIIFVGQGRRRTPAQSAQLRLTRDEFFGLLRSPVFLLLLGGMFLVNIPQVFASSQLKLVALDMGFPDQTATWMVSLYFIGTIIGRILCGLALDRIRPHVVALASLGLPAAGYFVLTLHIPAPAILVLAIFAIGFAQGAESDVGAFLIARRFGIKNYSLLYSFLNLMVAAGTSVGALVLSFTLTLGDSYGPFLLIAAVTTLLGAAFIGLTGKVRIKPGPAGAESHKAVVPDVAV